jgi:hypothetical protein
MEDGTFFLNLQRDVDLRINSSINTLIFCYCTAQDSTTCILGCKDFYNMTGLNYRLLVHRFFVILLLKTVQHAYKAATDFTI